MARRKVARKKALKRKPKAVSSKKSFSYPYTDKISIPKKLVDQVIGQESAVEVIKKAARQKRNVLLIGEPGTGKSMLAQALSELMPASELEDVLIYSNVNNENNPKVRVVKAGHGRKTVEASRAKLRMGGGNANLILIAFLFLSSMILLYYGRTHFGDIITAAMLIGLFLVVAAASFAMQLGKRGLLTETDQYKIIVDNFDQKIPPFIDATGAKAGALLGDVKHDPLQCFFPTSTVYVVEGNKTTPTTINEIVDKFLVKYPGLIQKDDKYEGIILPTEEELFVLGQKNGVVAPVRVTCVNRRVHNGQVVGVNYENAGLLVTPEHKVFADGIFVEAQSLSGKEKLVSHSEPIITKQDIVKTFSEKDGISAEKYFKFIELSKQNPSFGYKKLAKLLEVKEGQTRWWKNGLCKPKAVRTIERLEKLGLLPYTLSNKSAPAIARVLGTTFGDGGIFSTLNGIFLSSSEQSSLDAYVADLTGIFGTEIEKNFEKRISGVNQTGMVVWNTNRDVVRFFAALGAPIGRKNKQVSFPPWIHLNKVVETEFFGALLGNELCSPRFSPVENKIQYFGIGFAGVSELKENRLKLLNEIALYLNSYGVKTQSINENEFRENKFIWRLGISTEIEDLLKFYQRIPIRYSDAKIERVRLSIENVLERKKSKYAQLLEQNKSDKYIHSTLRVSPGLMQKILSEEKISFDGNKIDYNGFVYNLTTESGNLFANQLLAKNSGGLGTPAHLRVEGGAIHKANKGVLFIDEIATLRPHSQQELLTAMQERKYSITGQSEMSSGALVKTEAVPCDFVLVASGNFMDLRKMHPALRSRIRGYGYEIYMQDSIEDNDANRDKLVQFIAQEVTKDGKIPHFDPSACELIVEEAKKRSSRKNKFTLKLRELGGLIRAAGDLAKERGHKYVTGQDVTDAKKISRTLEQQVAEQIVSQRKEYSVFGIKGNEVGKVNGLAVMADSGIIMPIVAEVAPSASKDEGRIIATGKLGAIAKEAVENVSAIIKKHTGKDTSRYDIHVQFLQTYEGVEGDSASISVATAVISAIENVAIDQSIALTGSLSVRGEVLPVGGVTQKVEAAVDAGITTVLVPKANVGDIVLSKEKLGKIKIIPVQNIYQVLSYSLKPGKNKAKLLSKIKKEFHE